MDSLLEPKLSGIRPLWTGELRLEYTSGLAWMNDLGLVRKRLGWRVLGSDDVRTHSWGYTALEGDGAERWAHLLLPVQHGYELPTQVQQALSSAEGRRQFIDVLNRVKQVPYTEPRTRWERLGDEELLW